MQRTHDVTMRRCDDATHARCEDVTMRRCDDATHARRDDVTMRRCNARTMWRCDDVTMRRCDDQTNGRRHARETQGGRHLGRSARASSCRGSRRGTASSRWGDARRIQPLMTVPGLVHVGDKCRAVWIRRSFRPSPAHGAKQTADVRSTDGVHARACVRVEGGRVWSR